MIKRRAVYFTAPHQVEVRDGRLRELQPGELLVKTLASAISHGTESLIYQGMFPPELTLDDNLEALTGGFAYPTRYGYCAVGEVITAGSDDLSGWIGKKVFAFNPHDSHFVAAAESVFELPDGLAVEDAVFLPNMETAVNFVMDGAPLIGERVAVLGQGIVGLLTTALLGHFPLERLLTVDHYPLRREASLQLGAHASLETEAALEHANRLGGMDVCFELTGSPGALDTAIGMTGFHGRVVIGSWYGQKRAPLDLGGKFHRSRIRLVSSQVSTIAPEYSGRWDKPRRFAVAWEMLRQVRPSRLITQRYSLDEAEQAYQLIEEHPDETIQIVLTYP